MTSKYHHHNNKSYFAVEVHKISDKDTRKYINEFEGSLTGWYQIGKVSPTCVSENNRQPCELRNYNTSKSHVRNSWIVKEVVNISIEAGIVIVLSLILEHS